MSMKIALDYLPNNLPLNYLQENTFLYQVIDAVEASIYWKDLSGKYIGCNKYMLEMAGLDKEKIIGYTDYSLSWKNQANNIREIDELVISNKKTYKVEEAATIHNNILKTFLSSKSPLFNNLGEVIGIIGVSIDITKNKLIEEAFRNTEQKLEKYVAIKDRFLQNISHEHRTPLCGVLSAVEILNDNWDQFDDKVKFQTIQLILEESKRLSRLVINTLDTSNFIQGKITLDLQRYNLTAVIKKVIANYLSTYNKKIDIIFEITEDYFLVFDQIQIEKVITNLIINAEKYSPRQKLIIITLSRTFIKNSQLPAIHFRIQDKGTGIPQEEIYSIFEPFTESSRTATKAGGVGLGLTLCKEIIYSHAGEIWAENELLEGCSFNFCIPTTLPCTSQQKLLKINEAHDFNKNIIISDLNQIYQNVTKKPFALIGISPFNSYFSVEQILKIIFWIDREFDSFSIFMPDQISQYTLQALGYDQQRICYKIRKQDNYLKNKINKALSCFYENKGENTKIDIITISTVIHQKAYQSIYKQCIDMFNTSNEFRNGCLETTEWILLNNKQSTNKSISFFNKNIAVQYFLYELPFMINSPKLLGIESCSFVYHSMPRFLKHIYAGGFVSEAQQFLVLKE